MKKVQRSFAVEYKTGRRKSDKSHSIWGDVDLRSIARGIELETTPTMPPNADGGGTVDEPLLPSPELVNPLLTKPVRPSTTSEPAQETSMADENETLLDSDVPPAPELADEPKKQREPRTPRAVTQPADSLADPAIKKQRRGPKPKLNKGAEKTKRTPANRASVAVEGASVPASLAAVDEMADLLQLEEENQRLRKLLAEKLRGENADLRKRLNLD